MATIVSHTVLYIGKLLREWTLKFPLQEKNTHKTVTV